MNTSTSPKVEYSFENGSDNTIRITGMTYPDGRNVVDDYGTTDGINDASSRIFGMKNSEAGTNLVEYEYLGRSRQLPSPFRRGVGGEGAATPTAPRRTSSTR